MSRQTDFFVGGGQALELGRHFADAVQVERIGERGPLAGLPCGIVGNPPVIDLQCNPLGGQEPIELGWIARLFLADFLPKSVQRLLYLRMGGIGRLHARRQQLQALQRGERLGRQEIDRLVVALQRQCGQALAIIVRLIGVERTGHHRLRQAHDLAVPVAEFRDLGHPVGIECPLRQIAAFQREPDCVFGPHQGGLVVGAHSPGQILHELRPEFWSGPYLGFYGFRAQ